jgi:hypothetical protein
MTKKFDNDYDSKVHADEMTRLMAGRKSIPEMQVEDLELALKYAKDDEHRRELEEKLADAKIELARWRKSAVR